MNKKTLSSVFLLQIIIYKCNIKYMGKIITTKQKVQNNSKKIKKSVKMHKISKVVFWFIFSTLSLTAVYLVVSLFVGDRFNLLVFGKSTRDNFGDLTWCCLAIFLLFLPSILEKKIKKEFPGYLYLLFIVFLFLSIYLGRIRSFYKIFVGFDTFVHTFSGVIAGLFGFSILTIVYKSKKITFGPFFALIFSMCFAISIGVFWEIYEFIHDIITTSNMQRYGNALTKEPFIGQNALLDTMKDLILNTIGGFVAGVMGFFTLKIDQKKFKKSYATKTKEQ